MSNRQRPPHADAAVDIEGRAGEPARWRGRGGGPRLYRGLRGGRVWIMDGGRDAPLDDAGRRLLWKIFVGVVVVGIVIIGLGLTGH